MSPLLASTPHHDTLRRTANTAMDESRTEEYTYIVIGGGIAGVTCAEHLYILHPEAQTLVLTASALIKAVTNVLSLTKTLDSFEVEEHHPDILQSKCPSVRVLQDAVDHLDAKNQLVFTSSGRCFSYQQLCLCTGATPKLLSEGPHVLWLRDTESVLQFQSRIKDARRIMIVGNGGIATEMVYEVTDVEVVWAMKDKHMSAHFIDPGAAAFFHPEVVKEKVECPAPSKRRKYTIDHSKVSRNSVVGGALGPDWLAGLELKGKTERHIIMEHEVEVRKILEPEQVRELQATVTHLSSEEGNSFSLGEDGGLLIDEKMETTEKNVYAAGDVCSHGWPAAPHWFQMRLWTQARQMGSYAAKCLWSAQVGEETYLDFCFELFSHATKFFGQKVILLGLFNGQGLDGKYEILLRYTQGVEYIKCVMVEGRMQGAVLIGETDMEETFENLILNQMDLSVYGEDLLNPDVDIEDYFD
ncbi:Pyridine nucleotide-disulfide oxidoreductase domain-containing protein 1 [Chionoecetes opilio]|uniref:Pyridine nucleotide-disulfide oxidoreductase domain-containing protein 1 n=1 Tax=Chionoecetes opilio TaxID=41210 RepID=A0A8J5C5B7_CHIOP|nr:Pyridine nucleotide-disulfide oxidoreductase domain-containing protein 1 [Chionoecetes opilio]